MAREAPQNPEVAKIERPFSARDLAYCDMQGNIFMAAIDRGLPMEEFAPIYMNSRLAGVIDYSFSLAGGMETDDLSDFLHIPLLVKSPHLIVDVVMWLDKAVSCADPSESTNTAVVQACLSMEEDEQTEELADSDWMHDMDEKTLADVYEYAYWLGFIYRCECLMHDESSRMVYGAFSEAFMKRYYSELAMNDDSLLECAQEICRRLDILLVGKLWRYHDD